MSAFLASRRVRAISAPRPPSDRINRLEGRLKFLTQAKFGFRLVHDLVFAVTANELAQENKYKELLRGPDHQERTINSNYNRWNPCVTAEVSVDVTNDGQHWRARGVPSLH